MSRSIFLAFGMFPVVVRDAPLVAGDWERNRWSALPLLYDGLGMLIPVLPDRIPIHHVSITREAHCHSGALNENLDWRKK